MWVFSFVNGPEKKPSVSYLTISAASSDLSSAPGGKRLVSVRQSWVFLLKLRLSSDSGLCPDSETMDTGLAVKLSRSGSGLSSPKMRLSGSSLSGAIRSKCSTSTRCVSPISCTVMYTTGLVSSSRSLYSLTPKYSSAAGTAHTSYNRNTHKQNCGGDSSGQGG